MVLVLGGGYNEYKDVWSTPIDRIELPVEREPGNPREIMVRCIAVIKQSLPLGPIQSFTKQI